MYVTLMFYIYILYTPGWIFQPKKREKKIAFFYHWATNAEYDFFLVVHYIFFFFSPSYS